MTAGRIAFLARYPVKGFSAEPLAEVPLAAGAHVPGDRQFAIENGPSGFDAARPEHQPKIKFLCLMKNPCLSAYQTRYDAVSGVLSIFRAGRLLVAGDLGTEEGRSAVELFCAAEFAEELRGAPRLLTAPAGFRFVDSGKSGFVSILNLASVAALAGLVGRDQLDPGRFRMNIGVEGLPAWGEFDLVGRVFSLGAVRLRGLKATQRCAAINVAPGSGARDLALPREMSQSLGHADCGIYAEVIEGGTIRPGDRLILS